MPNIQHIASKNTLPYTPNFVLIKFFKQFIITVIKKINPSYKIFSLTISRIRFLRDIFRKTFLFFAVFLLCFIKAPFLEVVGFLLESVN